MQERSRGSPTELAISFMAKCHVVSNIPSSVYGIQFEASTCAMIFGLAASLMSRENCGIRPILSDQALNKIRNPTSKKSGVFLPNAANLLV